MFPQVDPAPYLIVETQDTTRYNFPRPRPSPLQPIKENDRLEADQMGLRSAPTGLGSDWELVPSQMMDSSSDEDVSRNVLSGCCLDCCKSGCSRKPSELIKFRVSGHVTSLKTRLLQQGRKKLSMMKSHSSLDLTTLAMNKVESA